MKYQSFRPINRITCSTKLSKAFDFLPKKKSGRHAGFLVTEAFEAAWKRVFGSDDFTPGAIRAAANRNDPRLEEVRRICTTHHSEEVCLREPTSNGSAPGLAIGGPGAHL
jgi:hypothetical protein